MVSFRSWIDFVWASAKTTEKQTEATRTRRQAEAHRRLFTPEQ